MMIKVTMSNNVKRTTEIFADTTTLRQALDQAEIDYSRGLVNLDGSPLQPGDLDRSFADFGISEKCFLSSIVKADNAATIAVVGEAVVITSNLLLDDIKAVEKYRPEKLRLKGGTDGTEVVFVVGVASNARGSLNSVGAEFGNIPQDDTGYATITIDRPRVGGMGTKEAVAERIGTAIIDINKMEAILPAVIEEITAEKNAIMANISVQ
jgi:hypothetical protein